MPILKFAVMISSEKVQLCILPGPVVCTPAQTQEQTYS